MTDQSLNSVDLPVRARDREPMPALAGVAADCAAVMLNAGLSVTMDAIRARYRLWAFAGRRYSPLLDPITAAYAWSACRRARRTVPAYAKHLAAAGGGAFPQTSKTGYVQAHRHASRCRRGRLDAIGTMIDESSGSSGTPMNWVRSDRELRMIHRNLANYVRHEFGGKNLFCINAFSMGAWATGINFTFAMREIGVVKSTGPDIESIIGTLETFGPGFDYLVTGYPPFLKLLADELARRDFPAARFRLNALAAGEPMTEALRDHLSHTFRKVRSGYGASDVQIGIGGETGFTVWLRRRLGSDRLLRQALLGADEDRCPMIFQYNPFETYIENTPGGEMLFTTPSGAILSPQPRYNLGDEGFVMSCREVVRRVSGVIGSRTLAELGILRDALRMPLVFLFGRSDHTISVMGANIYPQDVEHGLYADADDARELQRFMLEIAQDDADVAPTIHVELARPLPGAERNALAERLAKRVTRHLRAASRDYANALTELESCARMTVVTHGPGAGPFAGTGSSRIKNRYVLDASGRA